MPEKPTYKELENRARELEQADTGHKKIEIAKSEALFRGLFDNMTSGSAIYKVINDGSKGSDYIIKGLNKRGLEIEGKTLDQVIGKSLFELQPNIDESGLITVLKKVWKTGNPAYYPATTHQEKAFSNACENYVFKISSGEVVTINYNITDQKRYESERESTLNILKVMHRGDDLHALIKDIIILMQNWSGCEAVGVRIREGEDYPYFETKGFPEQFLITENKLCATDREGKLIRDNFGNPVLECMCGNVICGRFNPDLPFFTKKGSFWTNSTTKLLSSTTESDRQARTRNRCHGEGYESVALIPLIASNHRLGLLQFNDTKTDKFDVQKIELFERLASSLAIGLSQRMTSQALVESEANFKKMIEKAPLPMIIIKKNKNISFLNDKFTELFGYTLDDFSTEEKFWEITFSDETYRSKVKQSWTAAIEKTGRKKTDIDMQEWDLTIKDLTKRSCEFHLLPLGDRSLIVLNDITEKKKARMVLKESHRTLEKMVKKRTVELQDMNSALKVLLKKREMDKKELEDKIFTNYKLIIEPFIEKLKKSLANKDQKNLMNIIESNLKEFLEPFSQKLSNPMINLTPTEVRIASMIKQGLSNKEIAQTLNSSVRTITKHRDHIRRKLDLKNKKINLRSFLSSL